MTQPTQPGTAAVAEKTDGLPPFSGESTVCVKCSDSEAFTRFRPACPRGLWEYNGRTDMRGPLPERLERQCQRCDFQWDEALNPTPGARPATNQEIAYALQQSHAGWALDLSAECAAYMAHQLTEMLHLLVRLDHPMWLPRPGRPLLVPPQGPVEPNPQHTSAVPIPLHERPDIQAGPTAYTTATTE
ncbi:hypothetical protein [Streptomyces sp. ITFR-6]|uniref:hypothetical protein n=1 Tax=Streptomyces sp. ITFR-6 TaxID=3075197 RepID=UPI00288B73A8|nr:hypothetical protein [Streptomyces sp. ITFR-6]WNI31477.1 hypothetical protein RLT59_23810 [Streptomyces sp. ITFR-6]